MKLMDLARLSLLSLVLSACSFNNSWERTPSDAANKQRTAIKNLAYSSIIASKRDEVIQVLDKQPFIKINFEQISEYCHECTFKKYDTPLQECKKSDHVYLVRHLSAENSQGPLSFYKIGTVFYSTYSPRQEFPKVVKDPYLVCLDFELTDAYTEVFKSKIF